MWEGGGRQCRGGAPGCSQGRGGGHTLALWSLLTWPPSSRQALGEGLKEEEARSPQMQALGAGRVCWRALGRVPTSSCLEGEGRRL